MASIPILGFTGAYKDQVVSGYPLGNGYRWYLSALMRFNAPDDFSPFGPAGVNPYVYCADDPINRIDPTGHLSELAITGTFDHIVTEMADDTEYVSIPLAAQHARISTGQNASESNILNGVRLRGKHSSAENGRSLENGATIALSGPMGQVVKKPIPLSFRFATKDERVTSLEGDEVAQAGDAVMTGTRGENWVIKRKNFRNTYDVDLKAYDPYRHTGYAAKKPITVRAEQMSTAFEVEVSWQKTPLKGKPGDFRLIYGPGDFGVVDRDIFFETYMNPDGSSLAPAVF